jgi:hypothetical protein
MIYLFPNLKDLRIKTLLTSHFTNFDILKVKPITTKVTKEYHKEHKELNYQV